MYIGNNKPSNPIQYVQSSAEYPTKNSFTFMSTDISMCITLKHDKKVTNTNKIKVCCAAGCSICTRTWHSLHTASFVKFSLVQVE